MTTGSGSSSSINDSDETLGCESLPLSRIHLVKDGVLKFFHIYSIKDGALIFCHIAHEEESSRDRVHLIRNRRLRCHHTSIEVHQAYLISTVITLQSMAEINVYMWL